MTEPCCVESCENSKENKTDMNGELVTFLKFPSNQELKSKWLTAIGQSDWEPPAEARVCNANFKTEDIDEPNEPKKEYCSSIKESPGSPIIKELYNILDTGLLNCNPQLSYNNNTSVQKYNKAEKTTYLIRNLQNNMIIDETELGGSNDEAENGSDDGKIIIPYKKYEGDGCQQMYLEVKEELQELESNDEDYMFEFDDIYGSEVSDIEDIKVDLKPEPASDDWNEEMDEQCLNDENKDMYVLYLSDDDENAKSELQHFRSSNKNLKTKQTKECKELQDFFKVVKLSTRDQIAEWQEVKKKQNPMYQMFFECLTCSKIFTQQEQYQKHIINHDVVKGKAKCPVCELFFKDEFTVKMHVNRTHAKKYHCTLCSKIFNNRRISRKHQNWHFQNNEEYSDRYQVMRLSDKAKSQLLDVDSGETMRCKLCKITFVSERALRVHLLQSAIHRKKYGLDESVNDDPALKTTCRRCGEVCASTGALAQHVRARHPARHARTPTDSYPSPCEHCGEMIQTRRAHYWHYIRKHPMESYQPVITAICETCGKGFQNPTKLQIHELRHSTPSVSCSLCSGRFYDKYALARHMSVHNDQRPYRCELCNFTFKQKGNLLRHAKVHSTERAYQCSLCEKTFKYTTSMNLHIRTVHYHMPHPPRKKKQCRRVIKSEKQQAKEEEEDNNLTLQDIE